VWGRIERYSATLTQAVRDAERIVLDKAKAVLDLAATKVDDLSASDVSLLTAIATAASASNLTDAELGAIGEVLDLTIIPEAYRGNPVLFNSLRSGASDRLDRGFVPAYETRHAAFDAACTSAKTQLDTTWNTVETALGDLTTQTDGTFGPSQPQATTPSTGTQTTPAAAATPTPQQVPAPQSPAPQAGPAAPASSPETPAMQVPEPQRHITERLTPQPSTPAPADTPAPGDQPQAPGGVGPEDQSPTPAGDGGPVSAVGSGQQEPMGGQPAEATAPAAVSAQSSGYYPFYPPRFAPGGGDAEHQRKVTLKGKPVPEQPPSAAQDGVIGDAEDPAVYNEAQRLDDYLPRIQRPVSADDPPDDSGGQAVEKAEAEKEPAQVAWRLNKDGELEAVKIPVMMLKKEQGNRTP
jgi:hypothetical protein